MKPTTENVAYQKLTFQSSTSRVPALQDSAEAVDNDTTSTLATTSVTKTELSPWWYVDLGHIYEIEYIELYPGFELPPVEIRIGMNSPQAVKDGAFNLAVNKQVCCRTNDKRKKSCCRHDGLGGPSDHCRLHSTEKMIVECSHMPAFGQYVSLQVLPLKTMDYELPQPAVLSLREVKVRHEFTARFLSEDWKKEIKINKECLQHCITLLVWSS